MPETTSLQDWLQVDATAVGDGDAHDIVEFSYGSVQVIGTFVGTVQIQLSNDGVTWVNLGAAIAAASIVEINIYSKYIRANIASYTSGSISVVLIGKKS
jgi:hypothetical protein